jgi:hypothetical protein
MMVRPNTFHRTRGYKKKEANEAFVMVIFNKAKKKVFSRNVTKRGDLYIGDIHFFQALKEWIDKNISMKDIGDIKVFLERNRRDIVLHPEIEGRYTSTNIAKTTTAVILGNISKIEKMSRAKYQA